MSSRRRQAVEGGGRPGGDRRASARRRPSWDEYFLQLARQAASRSTCLRRQVGAVLVRDKRILATGYNGAPRGVAHCLDSGCLREELGIPSGGPTSSAAPSTPSRTP